MHDCFITASEIPHELPSYRLVQLPDQGVVTKFHALRPPSISIRDYLERLVQCAHARVRSTRRHQYVYLRTRRIQCQQVRKLFSRMLCAGAGIHRPPYPAQRFAPIIVECASVSRLSWAGRRRCSGSQCICNIERSSSTCKSQFHAAVSLSLQRC